MRTLKGLASSLWQRLARRRARPRQAGFLADQRGGVLVELALALPVLTVIVMGCYDATRFVLINQKLDRAASTMADLVSRPASISTAEVNLLFSAADEVVFPFNLNSNGRVIVSSVSRAVGGQPVVDWQLFDDSSLSVTSTLGTAGGAATMPAGFTVREGESLIVSEVYYSFNPQFLDQFIAASTLAQRAYRRPRLGSLSGLSS